MDSKVEGRGMFPFVPRSIRSGSSTSGKKLVTGQKSCGLQRRGKELFGENFTHFKEESVAQPRLYPRRMDVWRRPGPGQVSALPHVYPLIRLSVTCNRGKSHSVPDLSPAPLEIPEDRLKEGLWRPHDTTGP